MEDEEDDEKPLDEKDGRSRGVRDQLRRRPGGAKEGAKRGKAQSGNA